MDVARRYRRPAHFDPIVRKQAGGRFTDDWIEIKRPTLAIYQRAIANAGDTGSLQLHLAALLVHDWSFEDETGAKLPIEYKTLADADAELAVALTPLFEAVNDFLGRLISASESAEDSSS